MIRELTDVAVSVPTREWQVGTLDLGLGCQAKRVDNVPRLHHVWVRHWGEALEVATQALERIEEVVLAVELGNRCGNASHIRSHASIAQ